MAKHEELLYMNICIKGAGIWARGLTSFAEFAQAMQSDFQAIEKAEFENPKPTAIPAKERRRSGLIINLAVEVAHQACEQAQVDKSTLASIFVSAVGDTIITDYMCNKLNQTDKLLSPTKFHNSVHNAPSGYWTISAENRSPSSFIGGFLQSFGAGLLEAASQAHASQEPVLLVAYDIANNPPFHDVCKIAETIGAAFVIEPSDSAMNHSTVASSSCPEFPLNINANLKFSAAHQVGEQLPVSKALAKLANKNPIGGALTLLEHLVMVDQDRSVAKYLSFRATPKASIVLEF